MGSIPVSSDDIFVWEYIKIIRRVNVPSGFTTYLGGENFIPKIQF